MGKENQSAQRTTFTPQEIDRLDGFARMTDQIHHIPRQLQALPVGWRLMYPDGTPENQDNNFEVTEQHVGILARTAWNMYQTEFAPDPRLKAAADEIVQQTKAWFDEQDRRQPHDPSYLWRSE